MNDFYDQETLKKVQNTQKEILKDVLRVCEEKNIDVFLVFGSALGVVRHQGFIPWDDDIDVAMFREDFKKFRSIAKKELGDKYEFLTCADNKDYAVTVTHFQKKGTKFVSEDVKNCDYTPGINIDIFVFDHLAAGKCRRTLQYAEAWFLGRLLFLSGKGTPFIPYSGLKKRIAESICMFVRKMLRVFGITPRKIYRRFQRVSQRYNKKDTGYYAAFETPKPWLNAMTREDAYPFREMPFEDFQVKVMRNVDGHLKKIFGDYMKLPPVEKRVNHRPYLIDFGEDSDH